MKKFFSQFFSQKFLQKLSLLLLVLFFGGCEVALVPSAYLQYLLGDRQGVVTVDDISIINGGTPTMYFTVNSEATSATVYTLDSTNTLAFVEGAYNSHYDGAYTYAIYEGSNTKLWLANFDLKSGIYKLYSNGVVIDEGNFVWWVGDIDLEPEPEPSTTPSETLLGYIQKDSSYTETLWCKYNSNPREDDIYSTVLEFTDDGIAYDFMYETVLADPKIVETYSGIYYTTGTDTSATFKGVVDGETITVHLTEINGNTMKHVMYKGDSTEKYYEVTLEYFFGK